MRTNEPGTDLFIMAVRTTKTSATTKPWCT
jgi:hypothetical protein